MKMARSLNKHYLKLQLEENDETTMHVIIPSFPYLKRKINFASYSIYAQLQGKVFLTDMHCFGKENVNASTGRQSARRGKGHYRTNRPDLQQIKCRGEEGGKPTD